MTNPLQNLEGSGFILLRSDEQLMLSSDNGWALVIYNKHSLLSGEGNDLSPKDGDRVIVVATACSEHEASIKFVNGDTLVVDLSPDGYLGPEAMQLIGPDGEIIVWN